MEARRPEIMAQARGGHRVDGDSASSTELYALLSSLSGVPIKQGFAVTGSVDQHGRVQAVGGVEWRYALAEVNDFLGGLRPGELEEAVGEEASADTVAEEEPLPSAEETYDDIDVEARPEDFLPVSS